jgi:hypothetical protein
MAKLVRLPHWQDLDLRLAQEQAGACKEYDEGRAALAQLHTKLSMRDGAVDTAVERHVKHVDDVLEGRSGLTPVKARHIQSYQKGLAHKYRHRIAKRLAYPATLKDGDQPLGTAI